MKKTSFPLFQAAFPPTGDHVPFDPSRHDALAEKVPSALAAEWRNFGFGAYGGGLLWTPVPDEPFLNPDDWPSLDGTGIEVIRTAFASVCLWQGGQFLWVNIHTGKTSLLFPDAEILFDSSLIETHFRENVLKERLFHKATQQHGKINAEECFGFSPLPAFGGDIAEEYISKVQMREYVALAAQAFG